MSAEKLGLAMDQGRLTLTVLDDGSGVLLDQEKEALLSMNATGLAIVSAIGEGCRDEQRLAQRVSDRFDIDTQQALTDVRRFVSEMAGVL